MASPVVQIKGLTKFFGDRRAVDNLDLEIAHGECLALLGPNGAGKTTTIHIILGLVRPTAGSLKVFSLDLHKNLKSIKARIGVVPQTENLDPDLTVLENLITYASYFNISLAKAKKRARALLDFFALKGRRDEIIQHLSGGQRRRLLLARALINKPELLILDEPTIGLDPQARHLMWDRLEALRRQGTTMLLTTHYMEEVATLASRVQVIDRGKAVAQGEPETLVKQIVGREVFEIEDSIERLQALQEALSECPAETEMEGQKLYVYLHDGCKRLEELITGYPRLVRRPANLEDLFLKLTGRKLQET